MKPIPTSATWEEMRDHIIERFRRAGIPAKKGKPGPTKTKRGTEYSGIVGPKREKIYIDA